MHILVSLLIGALVGWLAGKIMHSKGGLIRNIVLGLLGGALGGWLGSLIGVEPTSWITRRLLPPDLDHAQTLQVTNPPLSPLNCRKRCGSSFLSPALCWRRGRGRIGAKGRWIVYGAFG